MASALSFVPWEPNRAGFDLDKQKWELYNIDEDFSQAHDLAAENPEKLRAAAGPLVGRGGEAQRAAARLARGRAAERRGDGPAEPRPATRTSFTYYPGQVGLPNDAAPRILNKSWTLTADIDVPEGGAEGMIVTHGGLVGGYGLYLRDGKPTFVYNYLALDRPTFAGDEPLPAGQGEARRRLRLRRRARRARQGRDGDAVGQRRRGRRGASWRRPSRSRFSLGEGLDIGMDVGSAVDFTYKPPFAFTGGIEQGDGRAPALTAPR